MPRKGRPLVSLKWHHRHRSLSTLRRPHVIRRRRHRPLEDAATAAAAAAVVAVERAREIQLEAACRRPLLAAAAAAAVTAATASVGLQPAKGTQGPERGTRSQLNQLSSCCSIVLRLLWKEIEL